MVGVDFFGGGERSMTEPQIDLKDERQKDIVKEALKEGLREWLDEQFARVGRWTLTGIAAAGFFVLMWTWLSLHGWKGPGG